MNKENAPALTAASERNYGIDLLKIVAMMFICVLHVCNFGGLNFSAASNPYNYRLVMMLKSLTYGALNMYAIISGFVGYNKKFKLSRPLLIWLELIFYTLTSTLLITVFTPSILPENAWFKSIMPVMTREYWYMTAYFGMVVLMPVLNAAVQKASVKTLSFVTLGVLVFYCTIPTIMNVSVFNLGSGYSTIWLCVLYVIGGYLAKLKKKPHPLITLAVFIIMVLITWILKMKDISLLHYTSPTTVLAAISLVLTFSQIKIKHKIPQKIISFIVPSTLGIFIIHVHTFFWENFVKNCAKGYADKNVFYLAVMILLLAAWIFIVCGIVDVVRRGLFWLIHIKPLLQKLDKALEKLFAGKKKTEEPPAETSLEDNTDK